MAAGTQPFSIAVGRFDAGTTDDLAVANLSSNNVSILLGDGAGNFTAAATSPAVGASPRSVTVGRFNGDSNDDLAVANQNSNDVSILLGDGAGNFTAAATSPASVAGPFSVTVGRFNGDANDDLAVANQNSSNVSILLGDGAGSFTTAGSSPEAVGPNPVSVTVGRFDGDATDDLAVANQSSTNVSILLGDGAGDFTAPATSPEPTGPNPSSVTVGRFDGDANDDLAVANLGSNNVSILLNTPAPEPDLEISKTASPDRVTVGSDIIYSLLVENNGPGNATNVKASDPLPAGVSFKAAGSSPNCSEAAGTVTCNFGVITVGDIDTATIVVSATTAGIKSNTATVDGAEPDSTPANNSSTASTQVNAAPSATTTTTTTPTTTTPPTPDPDPVFCNGREATIVGTGAGDTLRGTAGDDVISGLGGNDEIDGLKGDDLICGAGSGDQINGNGGDDEIFGGNGGDDLRGGAGKDELAGNARNDELAGNSGDDSLRGGAGGRDECAGGSGEDENAGGCDLTASVP